MPHEDNNSTDRPLDFIRQRVKADLDSGAVSQVVTRFPPEPNGYLHIGHAKAIWINYGMAQDFGGRFHLRFDDTNPIKEEAEFVEAIQDDLRWLGCDWGENLFFASDCFDAMYDYATDLIGKGLAYVDDQTPDEIRAGRGSLTGPGGKSLSRSA